MDEILVREPATGKLRGPFFPVCLFLSGLSSLSSHRGRICVFLAPTTGLGTWEALSGSR